MRTRGPYTARRCARCAPAARVCAVRRPGIHRGTASRSVGGTRASRNCWPCASSPARACACPCRPRRASAYSSRVWWRGGAEHAGTEVVLAPGTLPEPVLPAAAASAAAAARPRPPQASASDAAPARPCQPGRAAAPCRARRVALPNLHAAAAAAIAPVRPGHRPGRTRARPATPRCRPGSSAARTAPSKAPPPPHFLVAAPSPRGRPPSCARSSALRRWRAPTPTLERARNLKARISQATQSRTLWSNRTYEQA